MGTGDDNNHLPPSGNENTQLLSTEFKDNDSEKPPLPPPPTKRNRTKGKGSKKSEIWDHFTKLEDSVELRAACNYCGKDYCRDTKTCGTSPMWNHLNNQCKKYPYRVVDKKQKTLSWEVKVKQGDGGNGTLKAIHFTVEEARKRLAKMIILDELPFRFVEGEGFKSYSEYLQPRFAIPSRMTVARDCLEIFNEEKLKLKKILKSERVCLTTDAWSSIQNLNYMCLTAHWIDQNWNLNKRIINFCQLPNHKGETIGNAVESCLLDWGIEKFFTLTVDNASSNDGAIRYLKKTTKDWKHNILGQEFLHVRCCAHILNLIVQDGLRENHDSIVKVRNAIRYVRSSPSRWQSFKNCAEKKKIESKKFLCLDIETRWNSTYMMLEAVEKFQRAFDRLAVDEPSYLLYFIGDDELDEEESLGRGGRKKSRVLGPPKEEDWDKCRHLVKFLKLFYNVTLRFSGSLYVTSNSFFHDFINVQNKLVQLVGSTDELIKPMAIRMKKKFDKYWENWDNLNFCLYVAVVLDPRYKLGYVKFCFRKIYDDVKCKAATQKVEATLNRLYECYLSQHSIVSSNGKDENVALDASSYSGFDEENNDLCMESEWAKEVAEEQTSASKSEVSMYLVEACEKGNSDFDILGWWKANCIRFPILSNLARDILAIPVSTVASESAFSTSGRILDSYRSSLNPKTVEALICAQNWISTKQTINVHQVVEELENLKSIDEEFPSQLSNFEG